MTIKTLSLTQPWATLIVIGAKRCETRGRKDGRRPTFFAHRGLLAIHATRECDYRFMNTPECTKALNDGIKTPCAHLPQSAVIGLVTVVDDEPTRIITTENAHKFGSPLERFFGDYSQGRYVLVTENPIRFGIPDPCNGHLGLWNWTVPDRLHATVSLALQSISLQGGLF